MIVSCRVCRDLGDAGDAVYSGGVIVTESPEMLAALADGLRGRVIERVRIHEVVIERDFGIDFEPWVRVTLLLDDPATPTVTWPVAAVQAIDRLARSVAWDLGITTWLRIMHVSIREAEDIFPVEAITRARTAA